MFMNLFLALFFSSDLTDQWSATDLQNFLCHKKRKYYVLSNAHVDNEEMFRRFSVLSPSSCVKFCGSLCSDFHFSKRDFLHVTI